MFNSRRAIHLRETTQFFGHLQAKAEFDFFQFVGALFTLVLNFAVQQFVLRGQSADEIIGIALGQLQISDFGSEALDFFTSVPEQARPTDYLLRHIIARNCSRDCLLLSAMRLD